MKLKSLSYVPQADCIHQQCLCCVVVVLCVSSASHSFCRVLGAPLECTLASCVASLVKHVVGVCSNVNSTTERHGGRVTWHVGASENSGAHPTPRVPHRAKELHYACNPRPSAMAKRRPPAAARTLWELFEQLDAALQWAIIELLGAASIKNLRPCQIRGEWRRRTAVAAAGRRASSSQQPPAAAWLTLPHHCRRCRPCRRPSLSGRRRWCTRRNCCSAAGGQGWRRLQLHFGVTLVGWLGLCGREQSAVAHVHAGPSLARCAAVLL
jgi:hypothetical protein